MEKSDFTIDFDQSEQKFAVLYKEKVVFLDVDVVAASNFVAAIIAVSNGEPLPILKTRITPMTVMPRSTPKLWEIHD